MKTLIATIGFGTLLCFAACEGSEKASPTGTGGSGGFAGSGIGGSNGGALGATGGVGNWATGGASGLGVGGQSAGTKVSCDFTVDNMHVCTGFAGLDATALAQEQSACTQQNQGTFALTACASTNASGTCAFTSTGIGQFAGIPAGTGMTYVWYSLPANQIAGAQAVCTNTLGGTWTGA